MKAAVAIVEDNLEECAHLTEALQRYGREFDFSYELSCFGDAESFLAADPSGYQIVFMDIELPGVSGMDACYRLREKNSRILIVFVTSMQQYAVRGYGVDALGFLLKPVEYGDLTLAMTKVQRELGRMADTVLTLRNGSETLYLHEKEIVYIEVLGHNVIFHLADREITIYHTLSAIQKQLSPAFALCGKSFLVNLAKVRGVRGAEVYTEKGTLRISRFYRNSFLQALEAYMGGKYL